MGLNDNAVLVAAVGYVYVGPVGVTAPSPSAVHTFDPTQFGSQVSNIKVTGAPTGGTFTVTVGASTTSALPFNISLAAFQTAIESLTSVGAGLTTVTGVSISDSNGFTVAFSGGILAGTTLAVTTSATGLTGGSTPAVVATVVTAATSWVQVGHTARNDLPEFGFDGGKTELRGSWQKQRLREVEQGQPIEDMVKVTLQQWDKNTLPLYFGQNVSSVTGVYAADGLHTPIEKSVFIPIQDGLTTIGFFSPRAAVVRDAAVKLPIDDFAQLPIKATFLNYGTQPLFQWISTDLLS